MAETHMDAHPKTEALAKDPICGMTVRPGKAAGHIAHGGKDFYFCSLGCMAKFQADPGMNPSPKHPALEEKPKKIHEREAQGPKRIWTCPMHPEIERDAPGSCPKCGMALEPKGPISDSEDANPELESMQRRFWVSAILTVPLVVLAMAHMVSGLHLEAILPPAWQRGLELLLAIPVVAWGG